MHVNGFRQYADVKRFSAWDRLARSKQSLNKIHQFYEH